MLKLVLSRSQPESKQNRNEKMCLLGRCVHVYGDRFENFIFGILSQANGAGLRSLLSHPKGEEADEKPCTKAASLQLQKQKIPL